MSELNKRIEKLISEYDKNMERVINRVLNKNKKQSNSLVKSNLASPSVNKRSTSNSDILQTVALTSLFVESDEYIGITEAFSNKNHESYSESYDHGSRESYSSSSYSDSSSSSSSYDSGSSYSGDY